MRGMLPQRKHPRLKQYDYSSAGAYFITLCAHKRQCLFGHIVGAGSTPLNQGEMSAQPTEGFRLAEVAPAAMQYSDYGRIAEQQLLLLEQRFPFLKIEAYVIMPNHIHLLLQLEPKAAGASPRPTVEDIMCAYKSLTTRACKKISRIDKVFQVSFFEHVVRNQQDFDEISRYIANNPLQWELDHLYI